MADKKKVLDDLKGAAGEEEAPFTVEEGLKDEDLEDVSGGQECLCRCGVDVYPYDPTCGGGGGGGSLE